MTLDMLFNSRPTRELEFHESIALMLELSEVLTREVAGYTARLQETNQDYLTVFDGCPAYLPKIGSDRAIHYRIDPQKTVTIVVFFEDTVKIGVFSDKETINSGYIRSRDLAGFGGNKTWSNNSEAFKLLVSSVFELCKMLAVYNSVRAKAQEDTQLNDSRSFIKKLLGLR